MLWNERGIYSCKNMKPSERKNLYSGVTDVSIVVHFSACK